MATQLNIKDPRTIDLARTLAGQLGKSVTETIREALEEKADAREAAREERLAKMRAIVDQAYAAMPEDVRAMSLKEVMDSIYDEDGLPG